MPANSREQHILNHLLDFFTHDANFSQILDVVVYKKRYLPLRLLDWFVTNYSKKNDVCYNILRPNGLLEVFRVFRSYRAQLKGGKKKEFDPYCRGETIFLEYESPLDSSKIQFETAICQLKFFKWAIENLVLDYVEKNYDVIYEDMKKYGSKSEKVSPAPIAPPATTTAVLTTDLDPPTTVSSRRKRKTELSKSIYQSFHASNQPTTIMLVTAAN